MNSDPADRKNVARSIFFAGLAFILLLAASVASFYFMDASRKAAEAEQRRANAALIRKTRVAQVAYERAMDGGGESPARAEARVLLTTREPKNLKQYEGQYSLVTGNGDREFNFTTFIPQPIEGIVGLGVDPEMVNKGWVHIGGDWGRSVYARSDFNGTILRHVQQRRSTFMPWSRKTEVDWEIDFSTFPRITVTDRVKRTETGYRYVYIRPWWMK